MHLGHATCGQHGPIAISARVRVHDEPVREILDARHESRGRQRCPALEQHVRGDRNAPPAVEPGGHALGPGRIERREGPRHLERIEDVVLDVRLVALARSDLDEIAEHVEVRVAVVELRPGRRDEQLPCSKAPHVVLERGGAPIPVVESLDVSVPGDAAALRQEVAHRDRGRPRIVADVKPRDVHAYRCVEGELPRFDELHDRERREGLAHRRDRERRLRRDRTPGSVGDAEPAQMNSMIAFDDRQSHAGDARVPHLGLDEGIDTGDHVVFDAERLTRRDPYRHR